MASGVVSRRFATIRREHIGSVHRPRTSHAACCAHQSDKGVQRLVGLHDIKTLQSTESFRRDFRNGGPQVRSLWTAFLTQALIWLATTRWAPVIAGAVLDRHVVAPERLAVA